MQMAPVLFNSFAQVLPTSIHLLYFLSFDICLCESAEVGKHLHMIIKTKYTLKSQKHPKSQDDNSILSLPQEVLINLG